MIKITHILFGLVIDESVVLNVGSSPVLVHLILTGEVLHSLLHGEVSNCSVALCPVRNVQREQRNSLLTKTPSSAFELYNAHSATHPVLSFLFCINSKRGGRDMVLDTSTGVYTNWLFVLVWPVPFKVCTGGWDLLLVTN